MHRGGSLALLPFALAGAIRLVLLGWVGVGVLASVVALVAVLALLIRHHRGFRSYARAAASTVTVKPWFGRARSVPREAVSELVLVTADLGFSEPDQLLMLFLGEDGRCLLSLNCRGIPRSDLAAFAHGIDVPVSVRPDTLRPKQLRAAYPGSVSPLAGHSVLAGVVLGLAICVLVIGGVVGWAALTGQFGPPKPVALGVTQSEYAQRGRSGAPTAKVTVIRVDNPARASIPASAAEPGTHFVGVVLRVKNTGSQSLEPPTVYTALGGPKGALYDENGAVDPVGAGLNALTEIDPGKTETAYVLIRVPDAFVVTRVEYNSTLDGDADETLTWIVPPQPPPPTPTPAPLGQTLSLGDEQVAVIAVEDPVQSGPTTASLPQGDHLVGVEVRVTETGFRIGDPPYQSLSVVDSRGNRNDAADISANAGAAENPVKAGQTVTVTVYFDVPDGARVVEVDETYAPAALAGAPGEATVAWAAPPP